MAKSKEAKTEETAGQEETIAAAPKQQYIVLYRTNKKGAWVMLPVLYTSLLGAANKLRVQVNAVEAKALEVNVSDSECKFVTIKLS